MEKGWEIKYAEILSESDKAQILDFNVHNSFIYFVTAKYTFAFPVIGFIPYVPKEIRLNLLDALEWCRMVKEGCPEQTAIRLNFDLCRTIENNLYKYQK